MFSRLIRFLAVDGNIYYGDAILAPGTTDVAKSTNAKIIEGDIFSSNFRVTDKIVGIRKLLAPLDIKDIRTVRCLGLNYAQHAKESNMPIPSFPVVFVSTQIFLTINVLQPTNYYQYKPLTSITGPFDPVPIHPVVQADPGLDYECELVAIIGKEARDVSEDAALQYVLGYTVGNDVSHREWQLKKGGGQWSLGKGYDGWAPIGPTIVSSTVINDPQNLRITTKVNGTTVQDSSTADMIFGVAKTISLLSQGTTLMPGDLLFTGTPQGVGMGRKPQLWLKDGDQVEVSLEGVGSINNKIVFQRKATAKL